MPAQPKRGSNGGDGVTRLQLLNNKALAPEFGHGPSASFTEQFFIKTSRSRAKKSSVGLDPVEQVRLAATVNSQQSCVLKSSSEGLSPRPLPPQTTPSPRFPMSFHLNGMGNVTTQLLTLPSSLSRILADGIRWPAPWPLSRLDASASLLNMP
jgi:hypothetical protein